MRPVKKGDQGHFGMKLHIGVDTRTGMVHSLSAISANVHDPTESTGCYTVGSCRCGELRATSECGSAQRTWGWIWIGS